MSQIYSDQDESDETIRFDETDGAYEVGEPVDFDEPAARRSVLTRLPANPLRAEIASAPPGPIAALARPALPTLPILPDFAPVLPDGLRRGSTIAVANSVSLLLALLGRPSAAGAWTALVGMPMISADAAAEAGIDLARLAIISPPEGGWTAAAWTTAVGALLDAVDVVVARPGSTGLASTGLASTGLSSKGLGSTGLASTGFTSTISDAAARRLTARTRSKDAVLILFGQQAANWPAVEVHLSAQHAQWAGISNGHGRITTRRLIVSATGRGRSARPRTADLWLPAIPSPAIPDPVVPSPAIPDRAIFSGSGPENIARSAQRVAG